LTLFKQANYVEAQKCFKRAVASNEDNPIHHNNLGLANYHMNELEAAEKEFNIAIELDR
jgi:tetratricopeptide (TPR) repeat protein